MSDDKTFHIPINDWLEIVTAMEEAEELLLNQYADVADGRPNGAMRCAVQLRQALDKVWKP